MPTTRRLEFLPAVESADGDLPMAGFAERIRKSLVERRETAITMLSMAAAPLLDDGYLPNGYAVVTVDIQGQQVVVKAVTNLRDANGANYTLLVHA